MAAAQPSDAWTFLRAEEFADDDEVELAAAAMERSPEEAAMHEALLDVRAVHDPGRADVSAGADDDVREAVAVPFDDEEPETGPRPGADDHEPDLESILESQHYASAPGDDDGE